MFRPNQLGSPHGPATASQKSSSVDLFASQVDDEMLSHRGCR
jgi:hypothetical protein